MTVEKFENEYLNYARSSIEQGLKLTTKELLKEIALMQKWEYIELDNRALLLDMKRPEYISIIFNEGTINYTGNRIEGPLQDNFNYKEFKDLVLVKENVLRDYI